VFYGMFRVLWDVSYFRGRVVFYGMFHVLWDVPCFMGCFMFYGTCRVLGDVSCFMGRVVFYGTCQRHVRTEEDFGKEVLRVFFEKHGCKPDNRDNCWPCVAPFRRDVSLTRPIIGHFVVFYVLCLWVLMGRVVFGDVF